MKRVRSLVFQTLSMDDIVEFRKHLSVLIQGFRFNNQLGYGLTLIEEDGDLFTIKVIKRTPTFINDYDELANEFIKKQIFVFTEFRFVIDFKLNLIYVLGGLAHLNYVKYVFRELSSRPYEINHIDITALSTYKLLKERKFDARIEHLTISKFNFNNQMIGRFSGSMLKQDIALELLEQYKSDIVKASFSIKLEGLDNYTLQVLPNSVLKFLCNEDEIELITDHLKKIIFDNA